MNNNNKQKEIKSLQDFQEIYLPKNKKGNLPGIYTPHEYGVTLANQAIAKFRLTLRKG